MPKISKVEHKAPMLSDGGGFSRHDLSHFYGFKCSTGHVVPVYADILNPNERVDIKIDRHVRLQPMVTPAFMDLECQIDYFFIPMTMLLQDFERQFSNTNEYFSRLISFNGSRNLPLFDGHLFDSSNADFPLLRSRSNEGVEPFLGVDVNTYVTDNLPTFEDNGNRIVRLFDYLGLDLPSCFNDGIPIPDDPEGGGHPIDMLDDDGDVMTGPLRNLHGSAYRSSFPWKILAYNCIWQHFYRLDDFIQFDNSFFNLDGVSATSHDVDEFLEGNFSHQNVAEWCSIKYAPRSQDYFTSSVSSPVVQGLNILSNLLPQNEQWISGVKSQTLLEANSSLASSGSIISGSVGSASLNPDLHGPTIQSLSMARLRLVKAQEKLLQIYGRLPKKNYDTFVHALFGQKVPHDVKHEISHLGKQVFNVGVKAIYSAASTSGAELGELAGAGEGSDVGRHIKFTAPVHGIIMACQFIRPTYMYAGGFLRENSITTYNDFFLPMFDNLGRQPIYDYEFGVDTHYSQTYIAGWQFRWQEWKSKVNRVSRAFQFGNERSWFVVQDQQHSFIDIHSGSVSISNAFRYVSPSSLDDIMVQQFETHFKFGWLTGADYHNGKRWKDVLNYFVNPAMVFSTDPFICLNRVKSSKFSKMSRYSLQTID